MRDWEWQWEADRKLVAAIAGVIAVNAFLYYLYRGQTYVHIDAIAHVNKARGLLDNFELGLRNLGTIWLPLPHLLAAPLAVFDPLWRSGAAGSLISVACFIGTSVFLFLTGAAWTGSRIAGWVAFMLFALNPRMIYFFTTPEVETLTIFCASGLAYYLVRWTQAERWSDLAYAALFVFGGTWTRYEGWAIAAAACVVVSIVTRKQRIAATILFMGAAVLGPMLWMLFNMVYFDDPLMFGYGIGSAQANDAGKMFGTTGFVVESVMRYFIAVAYSVNPGVLWLALGGFGFALIFLTTRNWRPALVVIALSLAMFGFYALNLYRGDIAILLPGVTPDDPQSMYNVRYGAVMAAFVPLFAALLVFVVWHEAERRRALALLMLAPMVLPDPLPAASQEPLHQQFSPNLFYSEAIHNQSFWMPPFVEIAQHIGDSGLVMTNTRIVHVVVWTTGIPMKRFVTEMNEMVYGPSLNNIDPRIQWIVTEEGDQLWHGRGKWLQENWIEVARSKGPVTGTVYLFRRPD
jgi:hypothetical protein